MVRQDVTSAVPRDYTWKRRLSLLGGSLAVLAVCLVVRFGWGGKHASAEGTKSKTSEKSKAGKKKSKAAEADTEEEARVLQLDVVALVNGESVTRQDLAKACLRQYGEEVLESVVNKELITHHCRQQNIGVSREEVQAEIDRMAERFGLPTDQWLKMLKDERGINATQYAKDLIWPTIALRKLAAEKLDVSEEDLQAAYETQFGPAVQVRLIACDKEQKAEQVRALARKNPEDFGNLAKQHSVDVGSASAGGFIQPIRKHLGDNTLEKVAFSLQPGEISEIFKVGNQYLIVKCEQRIPATKTPLAKVKKELEEAVRDKKLRLEASDLLESLHKKSHVEFIFGNPAKSKQNAGVAAIVESKTITVRELAEECLVRHGNEVLEGVIQHRLLEQACQEQKISITREDLDEEIRVSAVAMGKVTDKDEPDVDAWLQAVIEDEGMTIDVYEHDVVWPTAALKKLVGDSVEVTKEDMQRGYEANFGPRVRCRAIVMNQLRRAQEVWELARKKRTVEAFGDLAEKYSIEVGTQKLRGEIPPIQKHSGQPLLEKEAFALKAGEISGVVQVDDKFVILYCEGYTKPTAVKFEEVRDDIYHDLYEKKSQIAMTQKLNELQDSSQVDNYLTGTTHAPVAERQKVSAKGKRNADESGERSAKGNKGRANTAGRSGKSDLER